MSEVAWFSSSEFASRVRASAKRCTYGIMVCICEDQNARRLGRRQPDASCGCGVCGTPTLIASAAVVVVDSLRSTKRVRLDGSTLVGVLIFAIDQKRLTSSPPPCIALRSGFFIPTIRSTLVQGRFFIFKIEVKTKCTIASCFFEIDGRYA